jgi:hypothetical protein
MKHLETRYYYYHPELDRYLSNVLRLPRTPYHTRADDILTNGVNGNPTLIVDNLYLHLTTFQNAEFKKTLAGLSKAYIRFFGIDGYKKFGLVIQSSDIYQALPSNLEELPEDHRNMQIRNALILSSKSGFSRLPNNIDFSKYRYILNLDINRRSREEYNQSVNELRASLRAYGLSRKFRSAGQLFLFQDTDSAALCKLASDHSCEFIDIEELLEHDPSKFDPYRRVI